MSSPPIAGTSETEMPQATMSPVRLSSPQPVIPRLGTTQHGVLAECNEAFRMLCDKCTTGTQTYGFTPKSLQELMVSIGMLRMQNATPGDGEGAVLDEVKELVRSVDQQQNGVVSLPEFASLMLRRIDAEDLDDMGLAFLSLDKESTGYVTTDQFVELFVVCGETSPLSEVEEMKRFADPENSGRINYAAFLSTLSLRLQ